MAQNLKVKRKGLVQRNEAIQYVQEWHEKNGDEDGVVYFADDDNFYSLDLFREGSGGVRGTRVVRGWLVGNAGQLKGEVSRDVCVLFLIILGGWF